jgi:hypothetical protein
MERVIWKHQSVQPFYVFEKQFVVHPWDDGFSVSSAAGWYQDIDARRSASLPPHVYLKALPLASFRSLVLSDRIPIDIKLSGPNLGTTKLTSGYSEADLGAFQRRIISQETRIFYDGDALIFAFNIATTPVDPVSAHAEMSKEDKAPKEFSYVFRVPCNDVPEFLNFTERERREFLRLRARAPIESQGTG